MRWQYNPDCLIAYYCNIWGIWLDTSILHFDIPLDSLELIYMMSLFSQSLVSLQESTFSCVAVTLLYCLFWVTSCVANLSFLKYFRQIWDAVVIFDFLLLIGLCFFLQFLSACQRQKKLKMFELEQYYNIMTTKITFPYETLTKAFLRNFADK